MGISVTSGLRAVNELSMRHGEGHEKSHFPNRGSFAAERISTISLKTTQRFDTVFENWTTHAAIAWNQVGRPRRWGNLRNSQRPNSLSMLKSLT
jgi:hypothetical protein